MSSTTPTLTPELSLLKKYSPPMFTATQSLLSVPQKKQHLSPKHQSLISLAIASASTHLYLPSIKKHTKLALDLGATVPEIVETLCLTSTLGIHACNIGVPLLLDVMREEGLVGDKTTGMEGMDKRQWELKEEFEKKRGYWHAFWEDFLRLDPEFFDAYLQFSSVPWTTTSTGSEAPQESESEGKEGKENKGVLPPVIKELVYVAFDAAATHLYQPGLRLHMQNVIRLGGTPEMIMEVLELCTALSVATLEVGLGVLDQELEGREQE